MPAAGRAALGRWRGRSCCRRRAARGLPRPTAPCRACPCLAGPRSAGPAQQALAELSGKRPKAHVTVVAPRTAASSSMHGCLGQDEAGRAPRHGPLGMRGLVSPSCAVVSLRRKHMGRVSPGARRRRRWAGRARRAMRPGRARAGTCGWAAGWARAARGCAAAAAQESKA